MGSPRINEAKYITISHVACSYTCLKKHCTFSSITSLIMQRFSEHERSGEIEMLQAEGSQKSLPGYWDSERSLSPDMSPIEHIYDE